MYEANSGGTSSSGKIAVTGGSETMLTCYEQADAVTMQRALDTRQRLEA